jgi:hypothetical protein
MGNEVRRVKRKGSSSAADYPHSGDAPMIRRKLLIATAAIACLIITACSDTVGPGSQGLAAVPAAAKVTPSVASSDQNDQGSRERCGKEVSFTKWYTTSPFMTGFTCYGPGTYAGEILSRIPDGDFVLLRARYEVTDPRGRHSFKAVIEGRLDNRTGAAVLTGVVTEGWRTGTDVSVTFQRILSCALAVGPSVPGVCFQGTIKIQKAGTGSDD